jgi:hypothetical protein
MRSASTILLTAVLMAGAMPLGAGELVLVFDFPADYAPAPTSYLVTYIASNAPTEAQQFRLPNRGRASCDGLPPGGALTVESVCGRPPECLAPGIYTFSVQAEWQGGEGSDSSPLATCEAQAGCAYNCDGVALPPALQALVRTPPGGGAPTVDAAEVARTVQALAQGRGGAAVASVTTPPPTIADIVDRVQPALQALPRTPV